MTEARNQESEIEKIEGDFFDRQKLIEILSKYIDILKKDAVIAIDAPWGTGKTWFAGKWKDYLEKEGHKVIYIDAFKQDYIEDPFLLIAAEINILAKNTSNSTQLKKNAVSVMQYLAPFATKLLIKGIGRVFIGKADIADDFEEIIKKANDEIADNSSKWITKEFEDFENGKASFDNYKKTLKDFCGDEPKPVVIFIDELDRCRPSFAVLLIERIKHLFDVENLIFVLLMNRIQLEKAIEGFYGSGTDSKEYLNKFVNIFFNLPEARFNKKSLKINSSSTSDFISSVLSNYKFSSNCLINIDNFTKSLSIWTYITKLSLRNIERACTLFALSGAAEKGNVTLLTYLIVIKIKNPDLFIRLAKNDHSLDFAIKFLETYKYQFRKVKLDSSKKSLQWHARIHLEAFEELHNLKENNQYKPKLLSEYGFELFYVDFTTHYIDIDKIFAENLNLIDLPIADDSKSLQQ